MSPEQLSGDKVDGRSDLYSLALVFYRMLTGKLPFEATSVQETMIKRLTDEPVKLGVSRPDLPFPPGLQEVLDAALTRSPVDRYRSAAKFAADVAAVLGTTRGPAIPATRAEAEGKTQLLDARGRAGAGPTKAVAAGRSTPTPTRKRAVVPIVVGAVVVLGGGGAAVAVLGGGHNADGSAVRSDTATRVAAANTRQTKRPQNPGCETKRPSGGQQVAPIDNAHSGNPTGSPAVSIDPAKAQDALDTLFLVRLDTSTAQMVLDSA